MKKLYLIIPIIIIFAVGSALLISRNSNKKSNKDFGQIAWWDVQSIDTVKYSRDLAREKAKDESFEEIIDKQVRLIAETGATHVAIGTPYDQEFLPFLKRWVIASRKYGLKVWFRGNVPGWEGWFGYPKIGRIEHTKLVKEFILTNGDLFEEGDIFSPCPECENGGPGDPRKIGDVSGHRKFLVEEYKVTNDAFRKIGKNVRSNFAPMNGDVANLIMDKTTTEALGNIVVIDHYVATPEKLFADIKNIAKKSGGKIVLGEFGAPIPDIHGSLTEEEQADWVQEALSEISQTSELVGINYWTGFGGSTKLWDENYNDRKVVGIISKYFNPTIITGFIRDERGFLVKNAIVSVGTKSAKTDNKGEFSLPTISQKFVLNVQANGYITQQIESDEQKYFTVVMVKESESILYKFQKVIYNYYTKLF